MIYVTESEMIERYVDSLKKAAARAEEFTTAKDVNKPKLFVDFIDGLKVAAGSAHQLAHAQMNPKWLDLRNVLEKIVEIGQELPTFEGTNHLWIKIKGNLEQLADKGQRMASARAVSRQDVLESLDHRLKNLPDLNG